MKPSAFTLEDALASATLYWNAKGASSRMMPIRAAVGVSELGPRTKAHTLTAAHGAQLLTGLRGRRLSKSSVSSYYAAFTRMLALNGISTVAWPKPGSNPRRVREPLSESDATKLYGWLCMNEYPETANLVEVLRGTGMRVEVEALNPDAWKLEESGKAFTGRLDQPDFMILRITGKGGHERVIPVEIATAGFLRKGDFLRVPYATHMHRWSQAVAALGITSKRPTPHAVRHLFATKAYEKSGKDLMVVKELLGHANVATTAGYIGVDVERLRAAI